MRAVLLVGVLAAGGTGHAARIVTDADGVQRRLDTPGRVTAVIYSNPQIQEWTRQAGQALDEFQGRPDFRIVVIVDLRGTMADWAPGYTVRRMKRDLDAEARRVAPFYAKNGNSADPRPELSAVPDFKGEASVGVGWNKPGALRRVIVFGKDGAEVHREENQSDLAAWRAAVAEALAR
jgi:hypothetical protein